MGKVLIVTFKDKEEALFSELIHFMDINCRIEMMKEFSDENCLKYGNLLIDSKSRNIKIKGELVRLTTTEFEILYLLASHPGWVYTYQQIYEAVWYEEYTCEKGSIMSHIQRLRRKIEADRHHPQYVENIQGIGYRFVG